MIFFFRYWRFFAGGLVILSLIGGLWTVKNNLIDRGRAQCENAVIIKTQNKVLKIEKIQRKIRSNRPSVKRVVNRLQNGTF